MSVLAQMAGEACIRKSEYIKETVSYVSRQRRLLSDGLKSLALRYIKVMLISYCFTASFHYMIYCLIREY